MSWPSCSGLIFSSAISSSLWLSSSSVMEGCGLLPKTDQHTACFMRQFLFLEITHSCCYRFSFFQESPSATLKEATTSRFLTLCHTQAHLQISFTACPQTSPRKERAPEKGKAMPGTQRLVYVTTYSNKLFSPVNKLTGLHPLPTLHSCFIFLPALRSPPLRPTSPCKSMLLGGIFVLKAVWILSTNVLQ